jgi:hypothetical protein
LNRLPIIKAGHGAIARTELLLGKDAQAKEEFRVLLCDKKAQAPTECIPHIRSEDAGHTRPSVFQSGGVRALPLATEVLKDDLANQFNDNGVLTDREELSAPQPEAIPQALELPKVHEYIALVQALSARPASVSLEDAGGRQIGEEFAAVDAALAQSGPVAEPMQGAVKTDHTAVGRIAEQPSVFLERIFAAHKTGPGSQNSEPNPPANTGAQSVEAAVFRGINALFGKPAMKDDLSADGELPISDTLQPYTVTASDSGPTAVLSRALMPKVQETRAGRPLNPDLLTGPDHSLKPKRPSHIFSKVDPRSSELETAKSADPAGLTNVRVPQFAPEIITGNGSLMAMELSTLTGAANSAIDPALSGLQVEKNDTMMGVGIAQVTQMTSNGQVMVSQVEKLAEELALPELYQTEIEEVTAEIGGRMRSVRLKLQPENLGEVIISVHRHHEKLRVEIRVQNDDAGRALLPEIDAITGVLSGMGLALDQFTLTTPGGGLTVVQSSAERGGSGPSQQQSGSPQQRPAGENDARHSGRRDMERDAEKNPKDRDIYI